MVQMRKKTVLVCGSHSCGKTSLISRFLDQPLADDVKISATVGLAEHAGRICFQGMSADHGVDITEEGVRLVPSSSLPAELAVMLPPDGIEVEFMEIGGGHGGHLRRVPRGQRIDGLILCYHLGDRSSFRHTAHLYMLHSSERHFADGGVAAASPLDAAQRSPSEAPAARLATVLCGSRSDEAEPPKQPGVTVEEADAFAAEAGIRFSGTASAKTGRGSEEILHGLLQAILEADEEAEFEHEFALRSSVTATSKAWSLPLTKGGQATALMTSPPGERPYEPSEICRLQTSPPQERLVEVFDEQGIPFGTKPLSTCLQTGLLHRGIHIWICDAETGGLLLRKHSKRAYKSPGIWGPTCCGEVYCYAADTVDGRGLGHRPSETSTDAAARIIREQTGLEKIHLEHLFSSRSRAAGCQEFLEVFVASFRRNVVPGLRLHEDEAVEWVHFLDVFGHGRGLDKSRIFHLEESYTASMVQKMKSRIVHADSMAHEARNALADGRLS
eukprot:TRINITY_DN48699_c0_g1_i1.p1 TRINITY_DN48699_c0_g1~~TRINITY_DN48699_c0_g1_i1.p1  ORF type:complete len:500 (+),score=83.47 TRINITY_DN48699_c0_g1_i1:85-1584(+)